VSSGATVTGGSDTNAGIHQWYNRNDGSGNDESFDSAGALKDIASQSGDTSQKIVAQAASEEALDDDFYTGPPDDTENRPAFYSLIAVIHR